MATLIRVVAALPVCVVACVVVRVAVMLSVLQRVAEGAGSAAGGDANEGRGSVACMCCSVCLQCVLQLC